MIPKLLSTGLLLFATLASFAQDAKSLVKKSYAKCQSVRNGYYEMDHYTKPMNYKDTLKSSFTCYFKKLKNDPLHASAFHITFPEEQYKNDVIYTGNELVRAHSYDSSATIWSKALWINDMREDFKSAVFCSPLTNWNNLFLPVDDGFMGYKHVYKFIDEEVVNDQTCYHIQVNRIPKTGSAEFAKTLREEYHYWIKKEDLLPIQYSSAFDVVMSDDTMYQYNKFIFTKYEINHLKDERMLTLASIPSWYSLKDYAPTVYPELLPVDTIAPRFKLSSITDEAISLAGLKGQVVLVDFFYKSCYPCMQAIPTLQALHEKYKGKGLRVIGIDPWDKKEEGLLLFLKKRRVTYSVLLGKEDIVKDYHVSAYPTMYLINKEGKIIYAQQGYDKHKESTLEELILKNL